MEVNRFIPGFQQNRDIAESTTALIQQYQQAHQSAPTQGELTSLLGEAATAYCANEPPLLSQDVFNLITEDFSYQDLARVAQISKYFNELVGNTERGKLANRANEIMRNPLVGLFYTTEAQTLGENEKVNIAFGVGGCSIAAAGVSMLGVIMSSGTAFSGNAVLGLLMSSTIGGGLVCGGPIFAFYTLYNGAAELHGKADDIRNSLMNRHDNGSSDAGSI